MAVIKENVPGIEFPLQIDRQYGAPIDKYSVFYSQSNAEEYAKNSPLAYVGQIVVIVSSDNNSAKVFVIADTSGKLTELTNTDVSEAIKEEVLRECKTYTDGEIVKVETSVKAYSDSKNSELEETLNNTIENTKTELETTIEQKFGELANALVFKGVVNSNDDLPSDPKVGDTWKIGTPGVYAGITCQTGDLIIWSDQNEWVVVQANEDGIVTNPGESVDENLVIFDGVTGKRIKDSKVSKSSVVDTIDKAHTHANKDKLDTIDKTQSEILEYTDTKVSDIENKLTTETTNREQSDTVLETLIINKFNEVKGNVSDLESKHDTFADEVNNKFNTQSEVNQNVTNRLSDLANKIDQEAIVRTSEDQQLQNGLDKISEDLNNLLTTNQVLVYKGTVPVNGLPLVYNVGDLYLITRDQELLGTSYTRGDFVVAIQQAKVYIDHTDTSIGFWNKTPGDNYAKFYLDGTKNYDSELGAFVVSDTNKLSLVLHQKYEKDGDLINSTDYNVGDYHYGVGNVDSAINVTAPQVSIDSTAVRAVLTSDYSNDPLTSKGGWVVTNHPNTPASERKIYNIDISFEGLTSQLVDCEIKCNYEFKTRSGWPSYTWSNQNVTIDALSFKFKVYKISHENWSKISGGTSWDDIPRV